MRRTPVLGRPPQILRRNIKPVPTPVVDGRQVLPIVELAKLQLDPAEIAAAAAVAGETGNYDAGWSRAYDDLIRTSCCFFATEFIRGPKEAPYHGRFLVGRHHLEWDAMIPRYDRMNILAARDHGKCKTAESLIFSADGRRVRMDSWKGGQVIGYDSKTFQLKRAWASPSRRMGEERCLRVTTRTGRQEMVAEDHRFATIDGWVFARELRIGDRIACPRTLPVCGEKPLRPGEAWLLGVLVGDGSLTGSGVKFTNGDERIWRAAQGICTGWGWGFARYPAKSVVHGLSAGADADAGPIPWLRAHGLMGCDSYQKHVPEAIFTAPNFDVTEFISGWMDTDGEVNTHGGGCVEIGTVNEEFARAGLHLLTRIGVVAVLSRKRGLYKGRVHLSWRLTIRGRSILRLAQQVRLRGAKGEQLAALACSQGQKAEGGSVDLLPKGVTKWLQYTSSWTRKRGGPGYDPGCDMTRDKARQVAKFQGNVRLRQLADAEILWDEVVNIEAMGLRPVYAVQVEGLQSYVGQDIVNHNSYFWTLAYPIWKAGFNQPGSLGYIFSSTQPEAEKFLKMIKDEILENPAFAHLIPVSGQRNWSAKEIGLRCGSVIRARGFGVKVRGGHPQWVVGDDVLDDEDIYSETIRRRNVDYFLSAIANMVPLQEHVPRRKRAQLVVVGTPMHQGDLYAALKQTGEYECRIYPARARDGTLLFPERYSEATLQRKRRELKSEARFAREFLCCLPGTMVETDRGQRPIEDLQAGDCVLTHRGRFRRIVRTFCHVYAGAIVRVRGRLHVTENHPILTPNGFIAAGDLVNGDSVTFPRPQLDVSVGTVSLLDGCSVPYLLTPDKKGAYCRGSAKHLPSGSVGKSGAKALPISVAVTPDFMYLVGLWLAEGHIGSGDKLVVWNFGYHETHTLAAECQRLISVVFGVSATVDEKPETGTTIVSVGSRILGDFLARHFGRGASAKRLPIWARGAHPDALWGLLRGYIDGDGHAESGTSVRVSSVSEMLLRDFQFVAAQCGLFSTIKKVHDGGESVILGRKVKVRPSWRMDFDGGSGKSVLQARKPPRTHLWGRIHNTLERAEYTGAVHNIEVDGDNSYVAEGVAVHNCQPLSDEASLFPGYLFEGSKVRQPYKLGLPASYWEDRGFLRYTGVDIAMSAETGGDYFVIFTVAIDGQGNRWIANLTRAKGWGFQKQLDAIKDEYYLLKPETILIEANQMQRVWADELVRETDLPVRKFFTTGVGGRQPAQPWKKGATSISANKHHLDRGVPALRISLENLKWRVPRGDEHAIELTDHWIGEMGAIGWIDGKVQSVGEHDDMVMACWMANTAVTMSASQKIDMITVGDEEKKAILAAPMAAEFGAAEAQSPVEQQTRKALAALYQGHSVEVDREAYVMGVRDELHRYVGDCLDGGAQARAVITLQEIKRLDGLHGVRAGDVHLARSKTGGYGGPSSWKPREYAPSIDDLGGF